MPSLTRVENTWKQKQGKFIKSTREPKAWISQEMVHLILNRKLINFVNLKSNSALLYNEGHNLLTSAFPQNMLK